MKKNVLIAFMLVTFLSLTSSKAQDLSLVNGKTITIKNGASLKVKGLVLKPSADFVMAASNSITKSSVPEVFGNTSSMSRVYNLENASSDYVGKIIFNYENTEMGTITHANAVLKVKNENGDWNNYADTDGVDNSVTHDFTSPIKIKSLTAADSGSLSLETLSNNAFFKVYPNPVVSKINISHNENIEATIFNHLGQAVLTTQEKSIDLSSYSKGVYILKVRNLNDNNIKNFKILKL